MSDTRGLVSSCAEYERRPKFINKNSIEEDKLICGISQMVGAI
jgi:hypothetical protein